MANKYPHTPDGRYFVAKNQLWRCTDPRLSDDEKRTHIKALMKARRAVRSAQQLNDELALRQAREAVQSAKELLGSAARYGGKTAPPMKVVLPLTIARMQSGGVSAPKARAFKPERC